MMRTGRAAVGCGICMFLVIMMPAVGGATLWHYTAIGSQLSGGQWGIPTYWGSVIIDDQLRDFGTGRPTTPDVLSEGNSRDLEFLVPQYSLKVGDTSFSGQTEIYINGIWPSGYAAPISLDVEFSAFGGLSATFYNADGSPYPRSWPEYSQLASLINTPFSASDISGNLWLIRDGTAAPPVPEPATLLLIGIGLAGLGVGFRNRSK